MQNLQKHLKKVLTKAKRVAILGVGSDLRSDDMAGIRVLEILDRYKTRGNKNIKLRTFYGYTAPENLTSEIKLFEPTHLIIVDSAEMGKAPGSAELINPDSAMSKISFSTHKLPIRVMADYIRNSIKCKIVIIGIQPKTLGFGKPMSKTIEASSKKVANIVRETVIQSDK